MYNRAVDKIRDEMAANADNGYVKVVGEYLTDYLEAHKSEAGKILAEGKTILGSLKVMSDAARKTAKNGCAVMSDEEGFKIVREYYDFGLTEPKPQVFADFEMPDIDTFLGV